MTINQSGWRPTMGEAGASHNAGTFTGNAALMLEEPLIFEIGSNDRCGVDFDVVSPLPFRGGAGG
ncbi:MAG: aminomethyl-transferring glycine dehydrogenase subunit GcvPB, partial [Sphingopyxis sp.]